MTEQPTWCKEVCINQSDWNSHNTVERFWNKYCIFQKSIGVFRVWPKLLTSLKNQVSWYLENREENATLVSVCLCKQKLCFTVPPIKYFLPITLALQETTLKIQHCLVLLHSEKCWGTSSLERICDGKQNQTGFPTFPWEAQQTRPTEGVTSLGDVDACDTGDIPYPIYWAVFDVLLNLFQFHRTHLNSIS